jgi:hypothetical protein
MNLEISVEARLSALEQLVSYCVSKLMSPQQIQADRTELHQTFAARPLFGEASDIDWARSTEFCQALDRLLEVAAEIQAGL